MPAPAAGMVFLVPDETCGAKQGARRGIDDRIRVDAVDAVEIGDVPRLAEMVDAGRHQRNRGGAAEPGQCRGMAVADRDERGARTESRQQALGAARLAARQSRPPFGMEPVGRGYGEETDTGDILAQLFAGG